MNLMLTENMPSVSALDGNSMQDFRIPKNDDGKHNICLTPGCVHAGNYYTVVSFF